MELANYTLDEPATIEMRTLIGQTLELTVAAIDTRLDRVELSATMTFDTWRVAESIGAFHLDLDPNDLDGGGEHDVEVVLVLRDVLVGLFDDCQGLVDVVFGEPDVLHQTEAWLLGSAMQVVEIDDATGTSASIGFRTMWAGSFVD